MVGRFVLWRNDPADPVNPTLAVAPDLAVAAAPVAGAAEGAGASEVAPDPIRGLVPPGTREISPTPDLEGSLAPSQEKENHILAIADHTPVHANPNLAHAPASPAPVQLTVNPSPVPRAALTAAPRPTGQSGILAVAQRRWLLTGSPVVDHLPQWQMGRQSALPNLSPAPHPRGRTTADPNRWRGAQSLAQDLAHDLAHGLDRLPRISEKWEEFLCCT